MSFHSLPTKTSESFNANCSLTKCGLVHCAFSKQIQASFTKQLQQKMGARHLRQLSEHSQSGALLLHDCHRAPRQIPSGLSP